jgi:acyl carrier protein
MSELASGATGADEIEAAVVRYLQDELNVDMSDVARDTQLVHTGILDSVSLLQLATWAEREFDIEIPDDDIDAEHLESVAMIVDYVNLKRGVR